MTCGKIVYILCGKDAQLAIGIFVTKTNLDVKRLSAARRELKLYVYIYCEMSPAAQCRYSSDFGIVGKTCEMLYKSALGGQLTLHG